MAEVTGMTPSKITQEITKETTNLKTYVNSGLSTKSDTTYVNSELSKKADTTYVNSELSKKADTTQVTSELSKKADTTQVTSELSKKADKTYVDSGLSKKADKTYVDSGLSKKADTTYVDSLSPLKSYAGTGSPEGKVSAPVGSIYTDTAATNGAIRWIKISGTGNTGWRVEYGDTGLRDMTAFIPTDAGWETSDSGRIVVQRIENVVYLTISAVVNSIGAAQYVTLVDLPDGLRPNRNQFGNTWRGVRTYFRTSGRLEFHTPSGPSDYWSFSYVTNDSWPTTLPGKPA